MPYTHRYFVLNKPYQMVSQFKSPDRVRLLGELDFQFPEGTHAIGRLDNHSEGLLLLTTDKRVTKLLFESERPHKRTYLVQVKNIMTTGTLEQLKNGVSIRIEAGNDYLARPESALLVTPPKGLSPLRAGYREDIPQSWLEITLTEGKYHQVRKMVAALGHRCKRLIRIAIEDIYLGDLAPGAVRELPATDFFRLLKIDHSDRS